MSHADFVHLRVHTAYSLSEGAIHIDKLAELCRSEAMPAVAMTDSANMFGALEFSETLAKAGVQPIIGVSLPVAVETEDRFNPGARRESPGALVLLAQNETGYRNLMALVSRAHLESAVDEAAHIALEDLESGRTEGLIALTGGADGPLGRLLRNGQAEAAADLAARLQALFPGRLYIELQRHGLEDEAATEPAFLDLAYARDIPLVATNQCYFPDAEMYEAHDALLCIAAGDYVASTERRRLTADYRFQSASEMRARFADLPEAADNTLVIARRCAFRVEPIDPILPAFATGTELTEAELLRRQAASGLEARLDAHVFSGGEDDAERERRAAPYRSRLAHELDIIETMGFPGYFLIVADFIQWAKDNAVPVGPGRGSGAGSVVAWALRITDLDPLRFSLLFERFLNPERVSMPDFDIDFCQDKRERVIQYVQQRYGRDRVAQIITFGKLQARAVLRDVGRVMEQPYPVTDRLCKMIPNNPADPKTLAQALTEEPRLAAEREKDRQTAEVIERALKLEGLYRHASTHAAGVVIGDRPLHEMVPLYRDPRASMPVTQFNMKWVEQAGLVKFDFLGLKTLTVLDRAVSLVRERGIEIDLSTIPFDDKATYEMLSDGETVGVFQLESAGMRNVLKGLKPDKFEDIIAIVALYRPGPMGNIPAFVNRKHGREAVSYPHPMLETILEETYGIAVYQEQVMQIAQVMAGYSLGEADLLRRAMGKKKADEMERQRVRFLEGAKERDVSEAKANEVFDLLAKFAEYGFNKSHAAAYALVAYHTAYMKANYPVELMAATMTLDMNNTDKLGAFKEELVQMGIPLLMPDVNASDVEFAVEPDPDARPDPDDPRAGRAIRYALAAVKGVGTRAMERLVAERQANGPYRDLFDLAERLDSAVVNKRQVEQLAAAGAFESLGADRARVFVAAETLGRHAQLAAQARESAQASLFGDSAGGAEQRPSLPDAESWTPTEALARELQAIGFYLSAHPLDAYAAVLKRERVLPADEVTAGLEYAGRTVKLAGAIEGFAERKARRTGNRFGVFSLSDTTGSFEVMVFEDELDTARALAEAGEPIVVDAEVRLREGDDAVRLSARSLAGLDRLAANSTVGLEIAISTADCADALKRALAPHEGGRARVSLRLLLGECEAVIDLPERYKITPPLIHQLDRQAGVARVEEV